MNRARAKKALIARSMTGGRGGYRRTYSHSSFADQPALTDKYGGELTLSRSAGGIYYFDSNNVLQYTGDNVAAFTANGLLVEGQATNLVAAANYRDFSTWSFDTTDATVSVNQVGIDVASNVACLLTDSSAGGFANKQLSLVVANDSVAYIIFFYLKKDSDTTRFPGVRTSFTGGTAVHQQSMVNSSTGAITTFSTSNGSHVVDDVGSFWRVTQFLANNSTGNTTLRINLYPALGTVFGTAAVATQGTAIFDWVTVCSNQVFQSPIQGAATRYTSFFSRPWIGAVTNFWVYLDFKVLYSSGVLAVSSRYLFSVYKDASNYFRALAVTGGSGIIRVQTNNAGVSQEADITSASIDRGDRVRMVVSYDTINGLRCRYSIGGGAAQTSSVATSAAAISGLSNGATFYLGSLEGVTTASVGPGEYRDYRIGTGILTVAQQQELIGA